MLALIPPCNMTTSKPVTYEYIIIYLNSNIIIVLSKGMIVKPNGYIVSVFNVDSYDN